MGYEISMFGVGQTSQSNVYYKLVSFVGSIWFIPTLSSIGVVLVPLKSGYFSIKLMDQGWREELGGQGAFRFVASGSVLCQ